MQSRILFDQMLGRGTRRGEKFPDKERFVVFDCFDGSLLEYFRATTGMTVEPPEGDNKTVAQIVEEIWQNKDRDYNVKRLVRRFRRIDKAMSGDARELFARFVANGDVGRFAEDLPALVRGHFTETLTILRDADFQRLLKDYPRARRTFLVAPAAQDTVSSEWLIKAGVGREYKPEDYLQAFEAFVRHYASEIDALAILLKRPEGWGAEALRELRTALTQAPEHFTEANLQRAFQAAKQKALVDIISMIKHAAEGASPLLTAEERVNVAVFRATHPLDLTPEQQKWLGYIHQHLVQNLSIEREDFDVVPVLSDRGGWGRANRVFAGQLSVLIQELNKELVAA